MQREGKWRADGRPLLLSLTPVTRSGRPPRTMPPCGVLSDDGFLSSWSAWRRPRPLRPQSEMRGSLCCPRALPRAPALSPPPAQKGRGGAHHLPALRAPGSAPRPCRWVGVVLAVSRPGPSAATVASVVFPCLVSLRCRVHSPLRTCERTPRGRLSLKPERLS